MRQEGVCNLERFVLRRGYDDAFCLIGGTARRTSREYPATLLQSQRIEGMKIMKALKLSVLLLAVLIAVTTMVSMLGAAGEGFDEHDRADITSSTDVPDHFIPPEYFMNARPATPLPESEMISFILSEKTLNTSAQDKRNWIIELPVSSLGQDVRFMKYKEHQNIFIEKNISPDDVVVLVRMPESMYERFLAGAENNTITLPASHFCKFYDNLTDLDTHIGCNGSVLTVLPGESDANKITTIPTPMETPGGPGESTLLTGITRATPLDDAIWFNVRASLPSEIIRVQGTIL